MREIPLSNARLTPQGFPFDRRFMLFKVPPKGSDAPLRRMTVTDFHNMTLFHPRIDFPEGGDHTKGILTIAYHPPDGEDSQEISMPLTPDITGLETVDTALHASPTKAYNMGSGYNSWFSSHFGYEVLFVYLGHNLRPLRGNLSPKLANGTDSSKSWLSGFTQLLPGFKTADETDEEGITFADMASYLVVSEESLADISSRLPEGLEMDMRKFRPNIVVSGATEPYEEDYWGALNIDGHEDDGDQPSSLELVLTQNCARCMSINIDFSTGQQGTGPAGSILKKMMKDRRVDKSNKWSPIFGRYAFLGTRSAKNCRIGIGDKVVVSRRNQERTGLGIRASRLCVRSH